MFFREIEAISRVTLESGTLGSLDFSALPFEPKRIYWLTDTGLEQVRGRHAHKKLSQCIFLMKGSCELRIQDELGAKEFHLTTDSQLVYIKPGLWRELKNFTEGTVVCVLADKSYDEEDYIRNFDEYLVWIKNER
jgi:hypothetical protein